MAADGGLAAGYQGPAHRPGDFASRRFVRPPIVVTGSSAGPCDAPHGPGEGRGDAGAATSTRVRRSDPRLMTAELLRHPEPQ